MERWPSGLRRTPGTRVYVKAYRGFESLSVRQITLISHCSCKLYFSFRPIRPTYRPTTLLDVGGRCRSCLDGTLVDTEAQNSARNQLSFAYGVSSSSFRCERTSTASPGRAMAPARFERQS